MYTNENEWGCNICLEDKLEHELETIYAPVKPTAKPLLKYSKKGQIVMKKFELIPEETLNWFGRTLWWLR